MPFKKDDPKTKEWQAKGGKVKAQKTREGESIGEYLLTHGAEQCVGAMQELYLEDKKAYLSSFKDILEYFKPKLARTESDITSGGEKLQINPIAYAPNNNSAQL